MSRAVSDAPYRQGVGVSKSLRNAEDAMDLGIADAEAGGIAQAMRTLDLAIKLDPSLRRAYFQLAKAL